MFLQPKRSREASRHCPGAGHARNRDGRREAGSPMATSSRSCRLSGADADPERPVSGNWMNNTRAWLVGRNLPAMHAAEINAAVADVAQARRCRSVAHQRARHRRRGSRPAARCGGQSADRSRARSIARRTACAPRSTPDSHQPARRRHPRVRREVGSRRPARSAAAAIGHLEGPDRLDGQRRSRSRGAIPTAPAIRTCFAERV